MTELDSTSHSNSGGGLLEHACQPDPVRVYAEPQAKSGAWNMAVDEYLLETSLSENLKVLRIYQWEEATVSLGYFQDAVEHTQSPEFRGTPAVRRLSGGGAILHDRELTYSFVLPPGDPLAAEPTRLYASVHAAIVAVLRRYGVPCAMRGEDRKSAVEPFLCFVRGDRHDIVCEGHKVAGSAQRRRRGAVLQHGSILLEHSPLAGHVPGIADLVPGFFPAADSGAVDASSSRGSPGASRWTGAPGKSEFLKQLADELGHAIGRTLGPLDLVAGWPEQAQSRIEELQRDRYSSLDWSRRSRRGSRR